MLLDRHCATAGRAAAGPSSTAHTATHQTSQVEGGADETRIAALATLKAAVVEPENVLAAREEPGHAQSDLPYPPGGVFPAKPKPAIIDDCIPLEWVPSVVAALVAGASAAG